MDKTNPAVRGCRGAACCAQNHQKIRARQAALLRGLNLQTYTCKKSRIPSAASRPSQIAVTTKSEPRTISPPAKTLGLLVWNLNCCCSGATTPPQSLVLTQLVSNQGCGLGRKPKAI